MRNRTCDHYIRIQKTSVSYFQCLKHKRHTFKSSFLAAKLSWYVWFHGTTRILVFYIHQNGHFLQQGEVGCIHENLSEILISPFFLSSRFNNQYG